MDLEITAIFCRSADFSASVGHQDDPRCEMNTAEVMTTALTAAAFFNGDHERSRCFLKEYGYIPDMVSEVRFNRRLHRIPDALRRSFMNLSR